jgi:hypothetical protein
VRGFAVDRGRHKESPLFDVHLRGLGFELEAALEFRRRPKGQALAGYLPLKN